MADFIKNLHRTPIYSTPSLHPIITYTHIHTHIHQNKNNLSSSIEKKLQFFSYVLFSCESLKLYYITYDIYLFYMLLNLPAFVINPFPKPSLLNQKEKNQKEIFFFNNNNNNS